MSVALPYWPLIPLASLLVFGIHLWRTRRWDVGRTFEWTGWAAQWFYGDVIANQLGLLGLLYYVLLAVANATNSTADLALLASDLLLFLLALIGAFPSLGQFNFQRDPFLVASDGQRFLAALLFSLANWALGTWGWYCFFVRPWATPAWEWNGFLLAISAIAAWWCGFVAQYQTHWLGHYLMLGRAPRYSVDFGKLVPALLTGTFDLSEIVTEIHAPAIRITAPAPPRVIATPASPPAAKEPTL